MRCLIIGLGIYGFNLAVDLTNQGHEVIGADINPSLVEGIKDYISAAYIIDSTDEAALGVLPLVGVDLVIVAIGENFGASVKTVALLKKFGVKRIYARAIDQLHESILEGLHVDRIITPEQRAADDLTQEMALGDGAEVLKVTDGSYVLKFTAPDYFVGLKYSALDMTGDFGLTLIAVVRPTESKNILGLSGKKPELLNLGSDADDELRVEKGDIFTCFGSAAAYRAMLRRVSLS